MKFLLVVCCAAIVFANVCRADDEPAVEPEAEAAPAAGDKFFEDLQRLAGEDRPLPKEFKESTVGFDLHGDEFYFDDRMVQEQYKRSKYRSTQITLGGQAVDQTGKHVLPAVNPFVVAMRSTVGAGTSDERFDVKDNGVDAQFFGLYHGEKGHFVLNKLRAHLLTKLANEVQHHLPLLDRTGEDDAEGHEDAVQKIRDELVSAIREVYANLNKDIRSAMKSSQSTYAEAAVAIISNNFVVAINVGSGRILGYNSEFETVDMTPTQSDSNYLGVFGRDELLHPDIQIFPRYYRDAEGDVQNIQFVLLESPFVASGTPQDRVFDTITKIVHNFKDDPSLEQELYVQSASAVLDSAVTNTKLLDRFFKKQDHSVILVGLERDYNAVH